MKKLFLALCTILIVLVSSCSGGSKHSAVLTAQIEGIKLDTAYVYGLDLFGRIDTLPITEGVIKSTIPIDTLSFAYMYLPDGSHHPFFISPGDKIKVSYGHASFVVSGSAENDTLTSFIKSVENVDIKLAQLKVQEFVKRNPASYVSIYLLLKYYAYSSAPNLAMMKTLLEGLTGANKDRIIVDEMNELIRNNEDVFEKSAIPYFTLYGDNGKIITKSDFKDQYILMQFWASWDKKSRDQNDSLKLFYQQEKSNKQFAMIGVSLDNDKSSWKDAIKTDTLAWTQVRDSLGFLGNFVKQCVITQLPDNVLLNPEGKIIGKHLSINEIKDLINKEAELNANK